MTEIVGSLQGKVGQHQITKDNVKINITKQCDVTHELRESEREHGMIY